MTIETNLFEPLQIARSLNLDGIVREGVYVMVGGPNYETVAELKMLRELGRETYLYIYIQLAQPSVTSNTSPGVHASLTQL